MTEIVKYWIFHHVKYLSVTRQQTSKEWNTSHALEEGDVMLEDEPPLFELPRTLRVALAATAAKHKDKLYYKYAFKMFLMKHI